MVFRPLAEVAPATLHVDAKTSRKREAQMPAAHQLLTALGLSGFTNAQVFVGPMYRLADPDGDQVPALESYTPRQTNTLWNLAKDAGVSPDCAVDLEWDGQELTVTFSDRRRARARYELKRLGQGQKALVLRLSLASLADVSPQAQALEVADKIAAVCAGLSLEHRGRGCQPDEEIDPDDPLGLLAFAEVLTRAGVCDWNAGAIDNLSGLAKGWDGSADDLLAVARTLELA